MSYDIVNETVPSFIRRIGDHVMQGSNNTIIILGTDRAKIGPAKIEDGLGIPSAVDNGRRSGAVHIIAGRDDIEGNPDLDKDKAYLYLSMKTDIDKNLGTDQIEGDAGQTSAAILKSDAVRILARKDVKIVFDKEKSYIYLTKDSCVIKIQDSGYIKMENGKIVIDAANIQLGEGASEKIIKGNVFMSLFNSHMHPTAWGPSGAAIAGPPLPDGPMTQTHLSNRTAFVR